MQSMAVEITPRLPVGCCLPRGLNIYSAIAGAIGSLKGPKHGGANHRVMTMMKGLMETVQDWNSDDEIAAYLERIVRKEAGDRSGLIYGMGHAVYTLSDPRAVILKKKARELAVEKGEEVSARSLICFNG